MAMIEKMLISGVRSYPPSSNAVIEFQTPLTLIVGLNGTGKTSIIESLKYITTGDLPPGCKNSAFVHDPKIVGEKEVKAQVKLRFRDITGNRINCIRSMTSTQKLKKLETKSLEGVIMKITPTGEKESISSRCTDFTKEMISRLGVSKAVIENVIFCHQEDANWPLSEGKVLKQKFDQIFAATRYIKALESIRTVRKEQGGNVKEFNTELIYLTQTKDKAKDINADLSKAQGQVVLATEHVKKLTEESQPIELQLSELDSVSEELFQIEKKIGTLQSTKEQLNKNIQELEIKISNKFEGSYDDLKKNQSEFCKKLELKENSLCDLERFVKHINIDIDKLAQKRTNLIKQHGKLQQETETHQLCIEERDKLIVEIAAQYSLPGYNDESYTIEEADAFMTKMKNMYTSIVKEGKKKKNNYDEQFKALEQKIRNLERSLHGHEGGIEQRQKIIKANNIKLDDINKTLSTLAASENRLQTLEVELKRAESEINSFKSEFDSSQANEEINNVAKGKKQEELKLCQLREEEDLMIAQSKAQTKVDMLTTDIANKKDNIQSILCRHKDAVRTMFDSIPLTEDLKPKLAQYLRTKQSDLHTQSQEFQKVNQSVAAKESKRKMIEEELGEKKKKISQSKQRIHETCADNNYNEFREMIQQNVEKYSNTLVEIGAFEKIYKKYIQQLSRENDDEKGCPLCHRHFSSNREVRNLVEELRQKLHTVPEKRDENETLLGKEKLLLEKIQELAPVKSVFDNLTEEMPKLRETMFKLKKDIVVEKERFTEIEMVKAAIEQEERNARSMEADISKIDDYLFELKDLERQLNMESSKLQGVTPGQTMQSLRTEVQEKQDLVDNLSKKIEQKQRQLMDHQRQLGIREREANELKSQKLKLETELQKRLQLEHQEAEFVSANKGYESEVKEANSQLQPIRTALEKENENKNELDVERKQHDEEMRGKLERIKHNGDKVQLKIAAIKKYVEDGKENDIMDLEQELKTTEGRLAKKSKEKEGKTTYIAEIKEEIATQDLKRREIEDNLQLIKTSKDVVNLDSQIKTLKRELSAYGNYQQLSKQRNDLQERLNICQKEKAAMEGRLKGFENEVKRCQQDLASSMYANAETKHCQKLVELKTTELANQDLDKYYKALDKAIMKYHGLKLKEINKIIKEYWVKTYKGNDIDTIEIIADEDEEGSGASKARRSYHYRVCMAKGGTLLDMRGRCSAGQKVLASLIIRLALAETFCLNCGILALDEPTTNLDEKNIESLANSLKDIIELRMQQKNFQLLVITHDEDFVDALGRSDYVDSCFRVYKDANGHSKIHKQKLVGRNSESETDY